jgi:hypothetical protein
MRITGSGNLIPPHVARAYGVPNAKPFALPAATASVSPAAPATSLDQASTAKPATQSLVAGQVRGPIEFDGTSVPRPAAGVFHMYTRAADKIEAATAVQIGRTLDIKG